MELMRARDGRGDRERRCRPVGGHRGRSTVRMRVALAAAVVALVAPTYGEATFAGRNGLLLMGSTERMSPSSARRGKRIATVARTCGRSVRTGRTRPGIGCGDTGLFSPMGGRLAIDDGGDLCWGYEQRIGPPRRLVLVARTGQTVAE